MSHRLPFALVLSAALACAGCGTLHNVKLPAVAPPESPNAPVCRAFGGVRGDWAIMTEYPWKRTPYYVDYVVLPVLAGVVLFLDGAGDAVTLPYTVVEEARRAFYRPAESSYPDLGPVLMPDGTPLTLPAPPAAGPVGESVTPGG